MFNATLSDLSSALAARKISSVELTTLFLERIEAHNSTINAFIGLDREKSLAEARAADMRHATGDGGPFTGIPVAYKDNFCVRGWQATAASKILEKFVAPYTASTVARLQGAGMVTLGKTNMDEFAMGSSTETSYFGPTFNPWDLTRVPGGTSGGSAAAVAARLAPVAVGTDTGGSIRQPAAFCGLTGLKPTYGVVSRYGIIAHASSLDQAGPMAKSAEDCALLLNAMAGFDEKDSTSAQRENEDYTRELRADTKSKPLNGLRIGLPREFFGEGCDAGVGKAVETAIVEFRRLGATTVDVSLPNMKLSVPTYYIISMAEASSNLARYDGVRYGYRAPQYDDLNDMYRKTRAQGFGAEVKRRIFIGTYVLSHGYYDAYYLQAQRIRRLIADDFTRALSECDVLLGPTAPSTAFGIGEKITDPVQMYLSDIYTVSLNLAGLPGLSLPCGFANGLPVGLQLIGNYFGEAKMLNVAHQYQQATDWHLRLPDGIRGEG